MIYKIWDNNAKEYWSGKYTLEEAKKEVTNYIKENIKDELKLAKEEEREPYGFDKLQDIEIVVWDDEENFLEVIRQYFDIDDNICFSK